MFIPVDGVEVMPITDCDVISYVEKYTPYIIYAYYCFLTVFTNYATYCTVTCRLLGTVVWKKKKKLISRKGRDLANAFQVIPTSQKDVLFVY